ncbi:flagellar hook-length control protein FliK [Candidatus Avoscillospira sp. LCP25S3_F1]|uniref:flagellar hook-length control protein FliK n=1 Tax=Candidatus Avoscillospira sp. LCP25S3_F1 TaxID=3438825 RepID=UPI003F922B7B
MKMDINELVLQMTYAAAQVAQSTLPQTQEPTRTEDGKSFQNLMDEKRTERESKTAEAGAAATETAQQSQVAANGAPVMQQLAVMVTDTAVIPTVVNTAVAIPNGDASAVEAVTMVSTAMPETVVQEALPQETVLPQMQTAVETPVPEATAQPVAVPTEEPQQKSVEAPVEAETPVVATAAPETETQTLPVEDEVQVTVEQDAAPVRRQEQEVDETAVQTDGVSKPLFTDTETMPQRVGDAPVIDTESGDLESKLATKLNEALSKGSQRVEIRLTPENLGRVVIEMQRDPEGVLQVVLRTENSQAAKLLSEHSSALGLMLQNTQHTEVRVEVQQSQQNQNSQQQPDQNGGQGRGQQQQQRRQQADPERFLQQLRLGLLPT